MQLSDTGERYGLTPRLLHWTTVILVVVAWTLGTFGDDFPEGLARATALFIHISAGLLILIALVMRLAWRMVEPPPPPEPNEFGRWLGAFADPAARLAHYTLYALLIAVPIAGIVSQFARGNALPLFGIGEIPSPWIRDRAFAHNVTEVHEILANALVVVASFHAAAALVHHFVFRDNTLTRMLPRGNAGAGKKSQDSNGE
jgi:cytochrome b561